MENFILGPAEYQDRSLRYLTPKSPNSMSFCYRPFGESGREAMRAILVVLVALKIESELNYVADR